MNNQPQPLIQINFSNSLFIELLDLLLKPETGKLWLQKVVNLLKQLLSSKSIVLTTFIDNLTVFACDDAALIDDAVASNLTLSLSSGNGKLSSAPYWSNNHYIVPLSIEGYLAISWGLTPTDQDINSYKIIFTMLVNSLKNRTDLVAQEFNFSHQESLLMLEKIINRESHLKSQLTSIAKEVGTYLNVSRCQVKIFDQQSKGLNFVFDSLLSTEFVLPEYIEAISVIPSIEQEWVQRLQNGEVLLLNKQQSHFVDDLDSILSIQSILGQPLTYNGKIVGAVILHQCDYERVWRPEEISYLKSLSLFLSIIVGKELEINKKYREEVIDLTTGLINSDQLLRELNRIQCESKLKNSHFSLLMIDVEKLKDINSKMGFVAGNLVLSQVARHLKRLYGDLYKIARYSNDEFVIIMDHTDHNKARVEADKLKDHLSNISVLGVGTVEFNFSFSTFPTHSESTSELLTLLEQAMLLSKSRGRFQISSYDELKNMPKSNWQQLLTNALPEIILKRSSLKTGPDIIETINQQIDDFNNRKIYSVDIFESIQSLALALDAKDSYTEGHSSRVSEYAYLLAKELNLDLQEVEWIRLAAVMHDIGKIGIPESILCKPGRLTKEEYEVMKKHPVIGAKILKPIKPLERVANLVLYHHEYWDGSGYPNGLKKKEIPIGSRVVSIVDAYQAMTSNRPYRSSLPYEEAINRLRMGKEKQWEPDLVEMFIKLVS